MTRGFFTVVTMPWDGTMIIEHKTKKEALRSFSEEAKKVTFDKYGDVDMNSRLVGVALVHMDIKKQKGEWM